MPLHSLDPLDPKVTQFIQDNPQGVLTTYRRNGKAQMSIVTVRPHRGVIGVSITETWAKFNNLVRGRLFGGKLRAGHVSNTPTTLKCQSLH